MIYMTVGFILGFMVGKMVPRDTLTEKVRKMFAEMKRTKESQE